MIYGYFELVKNALKVPKNAFFPFTLTDIDRVDLSKAVLYILLDQTAAKMQAFKVCTVRESNPGRSKSNDSLLKRIAQRKWLPVKITRKPQFLNQAQSNGFSTYSLVIDDFDIYNIQIL